MSKPALRPFLSYYGAKWRAAPRYPAPKFDTIIEPFAGGAGYSLRYPDRKVMLYERNEIVAGVWDYLIRTPEKEILALPNLGPDQKVADLGVIQEAAWLIGFWCTHASDHPYTRLGQWAREGRPGFWGPKIKERIASQQQFIRHWVCLCVSYDEVDNNPDATWFIDPPYNNQAGRHYRYSDVDYAHLAEWARGRNGQVMVCENASATWMPFRPLYSLAGRVGKGQPQNKTVEGIWTNDQ